MADTRRKHTYGFEEECVIKEVILHEQDWALSLFACPLDHDIQGTLSMMS